MKSQSTLFQGAKRLNNVLLGIETFFMALITIALVAAIFIEVICRYFLFISAAWAEELTRYLFIWLTYIGSAYAVYEGSHTEIDVLKQVVANFKEPARRQGLRLLELFAILSTFLFLLVFGKLFFDYMMTFGPRPRPPPHEIPMGLVYLPVFIGVVLCALHEVYLFMEWMVRSREGGEPQGHRTMT